MRIAIDAMGGDHAPRAIVQGTLDVLSSVQDDELVLVGDEPLIRGILDDLGYSGKGLTIVHAPEVVEMDEPPVEALRRKRHSSIAIMAKEAADGNFDAVISAGNTGAFAAACQLRMRLLPGILRPGILVVFPTFSGPVALCDVGANIAPKPAHLYQYALMATVYVQHTLQVEKPTVGLISIGQESTKGNELVKATNKLLREDKQIDFVGNVEPRDFLNRPADILVCDGFVGNVILKLTEGLAENLFKTIAREMILKVPEMVSQLDITMKELYARHDYRERGGAPLLGVDGTCIIGHGSSDALAIKSAILNTRTLLKYQINQKITEILRQNPVQDGP